jgi:predicted transposase YbfD/YdcC
MGREKVKLKEYFTEVETIKEHNGYFYSVGEALTVVILGTLSGLKNVSQINQWSENEKVRCFLARNFGIERIPCYYWMLCLLKLIEPKSLNRCLIKWAQSLMPGGMEAKTISFDGKTICSTGKMDKYSSPMHIISAHLGELGITIAGQRVGSKSNEIPAVRQLISLLDVKGCIIVADAMHCQKETAALIIEKEADYLLNVKDNQALLKKDIEDYVQDKNLRKGMGFFSACEKNSGRVEVRNGFVTHDVSWLADKDEWKDLSCIGAINRQFTYKCKTTDEWHYYISSQKLSAEELMKRVRLEWSVESMHWLLDVHFGEDFCRIEDETVQQVLNVIRKIALNCVKTYKTKSGSKLPLSKIMFSCLLDCEKLTPVLLSLEN